MVVSKHLRYYLLYKKHYMLKGGHFVPVHGQIWVKLLQGTFGHLRIYFNLDKIYPLNLYGVANSARAEKRNICTFLPPNKDIWLLSSFIHLYFMQY